MTLRDILECVGIRREAAVKLPNGGSPLRNPFEITPDDFLAQAEDDFEFGGPAAQLNVLTNAKRAIDCQIDSVVAALGGSRDISRQRKLEFLVASGFVAPQLLKRVIQTRNLLEHEYRSPSTEDVETALEIASLFVNAIGRHVDGFEEDFVIGNEDEYLDSARFSRQVAVSFDHDRKVFSVVGETGVVSLADEMTLNQVAKGGRAIRRAIHPPTLVGSIDVASSDPAFTFLVRLVNAGERPQRVADALDRLFDFLQAEATA